MPHYLSVRVARKYGFLRQASIVLTSLPVRLLEAFLSTFTPPFQKELPGCKSLQTMTLLSDSTPAWSFSFQLEHHETQTGLFTCFLLGFVAIFGLVSYIWTSTAAIRLLFLACAPYTSSESSLANTGRELRSPRSHPAAQLSSLDANKAHGPVLLESIIDRPLTNKNSQNLDESTSCCTSPRARDETNPQRIFVGEQTSTNAVCNHAFAQPGHKFHVQDGYASGFFLASDGRHDTLAIDHDWISLMSYFSFSFLTTRFASCSG